MQYQKTEDPRSSLEKARRYDLVKFAEANGIDEVDPDMPAILIRRILKERHLTNIRISAPPLGSLPSSASSKLPEPFVSKTGREVKADDDLMRQWLERKAEAEGKARPAPALQAKAAPKPVAKAPAPEQPKMKAKPRPPKSGQHGRGLAALHALKKRCKDANIHIARTDKLVDLKEKLSNHLMSLSGAQ